MVPRKKKYTDSLAAVAKLLKRRGVWLWMTVISVLLAKVPRSDQPRFFFF